jgi:hypothetical protein
MQGCRMAASFCPVICGSTPPSEITASQQWQACDIDLNELGAFFSAIQSASEIWK